MRDQTIKNHIDNQNIHVKKEYIDDRLKQLEDLIIKHNNNFNNAHTAEDILYPQLIFEDEQENTPALLSKNIVSNNQEINADEVITDPLHRFITDAKLQEIDSKISSVDLEKAIDDSTKAMIANINSKFDNFLNAKDIAIGIRSLTEALNSNDKIKSLLELINSNISREEFLNHCNNLNHITDEDRKALNLLLQMIDTGYANWDADKGEAGYIENKPDSLPANGGDCETIDGYTAEDLLKNKKTSTIVIGCYNLHNEDSVDYVCNGKNDIDIFNEAINELSDGGTLCIREGSYNISTLNIKSNKNILIYGMGYSTILNIKELNIDGSVSLRDLQINNTNIDIKTERSNITNCLFESCNIIFDNMNSSIVSNNIFNAATFKFYGNCLNNIITNNIITSSSTLFYAGNTNLITNNINK